MKPSSLLPALAASALLAGAVVPATAAEWLAGIAANGRLVMFPSDDPEDVTVVKIRGLEDGEKLLGFDTSDITGFDIAGSDGTAYASPVLRKDKKSLRASLFTVDLATGTATLIGKIAGPWALTSLTAIGPVVE